MPVLRNNPKAELVVSRGAYLVLAFQGAIHLTFKIPPRGQGNVTTITRDVYIAIPAVIFSARLFFLTFLWEGHVQC